MPEGNLVLAPTDELRPDLAHLRVQPEIGCFQRQQASDCRRSLRGAPDGHEGFIRPFLRALTIHVTVGEIHHLFITTENRNGSAQFAAFEEVALEDREQGFGNSVTQIRHGVQMRDLMVIRSGSRRAELRSVGLISKDF